MDLASQDAILRLMARLHREDRLTVIFVSHLLNEIANYVHGLALIEDGRFDHGPVDDVLTSERLSALYRTPVLVERVGRAVVVLPAERA